MLLMQLFYNKNEFDDNDNEKDKKKNKKNYF